MPNSRVGDPTNGLVFKVIRMFYLDLNKPFQFRQLKSVALLELPFYLKLQCCYLVVLDNSFIKILAISSKVMHEYSNEVVSYTKEH